MASTDVVKPEPGGAPSAVLAGTSRPAGGSWLSWVGYPWIVLIASTLVQTSASFGNQAISPLAPFLVADLGLSKTNVGTLVTATYLGASLVLVLAGSLSDRFGVRSLFLIGMVLAGVPLALASVAPTYLWLLVPMGLYAIGNGFALPPTTRAIVEWFPTNRRGVAMGIKQTGVALAGMICGLIVPVLGEARITCPSWFSSLPILRACWQVVPLSGLEVGWRGAILVLGSITVLSGIIAWLAYRDRPDDPSAGPKPARPGFRTVMANRSLLILGGVTFLYAGVQLSLAGFMVLFLTEKVGMGVAEAGAMLALAQAGGIVGRIGWGIVSDVVFGGRRKIVMAIFSVMAAASSIALSMTGPETPRVVLLMTLVVAGVSAIGWNGINMLFVAEIAGRQASATAAGFNLTASYIGIMVCPPIFGWLVDMTGSYTSAFQAGAAASLASLCLLALIRVPERTSTE